MPAKVIVRDLWKRYGDVEAVRGVSFEIHEGEIFGLIGPNGAGKTTTIECVIGLNSPDQGFIEVCGIDARRDPYEVRQRIGAALQATALPAQITCREAIALFGAFYRHRIDSDALLERFSLTSKADMPVDTLSGGQQQRLALALAFVNMPELVFLDEPTAGLDAQSKRDLHGEILRMKHDGHTVLLTTHLLDEAETLCDRVAIIHSGRIVAAGSPRELVARSRHVQTISFRTTAPVSPELLAALPSVDRLVVTGTEGSLQTTEPGRTLLALVTVLETHGIGIDELHAQKATLEDVFVELTTAPAATT